MNALTAHVRAELAAVDVAEVSRVYRVRRHGSPMWRQWLRPMVHEHLALDRVSLRIHAGQCLGLSGPNGAGKSTLVKLLTGLLKPSDGRISVLGFDPGVRGARMLTQMGAVFGHKTSLWWDLPVRHSLEAMQRIYRVDPAEFHADAKRFARALSIDHLMERTVRQLSLGERIKCELVLALSHRPRVLLLDEPTIGVDMESKQQLRALIAQVMRDRQIAVLLTSHDVNDLIACCTHVALIHSGKVFGHDTLEGLLQRLGVARDNSRALESALIETFRARQGGHRSDIEFGSQVPVAAAEDDEGGSGD